MEKEQSNHPHAGVTGDLAALSINDLQQRLECSGDGLAMAEAQRRLSELGYNELPAEEANPLLKFLTYFWGPIPWMIEVAVILSALMQHWADFGIILTLLVVNALAWFFVNDRLKLVAYRIFDRQHSGLLAAQLTSPIKIQRT